MSGVAMISGLYVLPRVHRIDVWARQVWYEGLSGTLPPLRFHHTVGERRFFLRYACIAKLLDGQ